MSIQSPWQGIIASEAKQSGQVLQSSGSLPLVGSSLFSKSAIADFAWRSSQ
jgi:hypothetical protein